MAERAWLAAVHYERGQHVDRLLIDVAADLRGRAMRVGGVVQRSEGGKGSCATTVDVVDLRSGQAFNVWEQRGSCASGCRLDERGLLDVEPALLCAIADRVDVLIINRYGRAESLGRGLTDCFLAALAAGIPTLTAVRAPYTEPWSSFHGGYGQTLTFDAGAVTDWCIETGGACGPARRMRTSACEDRPSPRC